MFQKKIDELFNSIPNVFGIAEDILNTGFNEQSKDHDETLDNDTLGVQTGKLET